MDNPEYDHKMTDTLDQYNSKYNILFENNSQYLIRSWYREHLTYLFGDCCTRIVLLILPISLNIIIFNI